MYENKYLLREWHASKKHGHGHEYEYEYGYGYTYGHRHGHGTRWFSKKLEYRYNGNMSKMVF